MYLNLRTFILMILLLLAMQSFAALPDAAKQQEWNSHMIFAQELFVDELLELASTEFDCYLVPHALTRKIVPPPVRMPLIRVTICLKLLHI